MNSGVISAPKVVKWRTVAAGQGDEGGLFRAGALDFAAVGKDHFQQDGQQVGTSAREVVLVAGVAMTA